ncbi:hypothetical protein GCM10011487_57130 [Steroidobacter agaridevorans]|uniref:DUF4185 domain-containing protein n=1 Tax=Steroidobacter agaridevorans TaxID=2695856 RepID=A0A829YLJ8_9GAMM|nr:DUF4185 domain-containing protein [Steroidobacter agaridevorans]GFE83713.1 hypothetical protein GCM10011487_57130 [Steroidobacter agaridevorans]
MSWASDDRQYVSLCDGFGSSLMRADPKGMFNSRLLSIIGTPHDAAFNDIPGYPELFRPLGPLVTSSENVPRYYNFGTLALDDHIYQFLSTPNHDFNESGARFVGAKLIFSPDNGRTWKNQNKTTSVVWESWEQRSRQTMVFFQEDNDTFALLSILQMGRNYEHNQDGYVYVYAPNGSTEGSMNELVMFRVQKARLLHRESYEYFAGLDSRGNPKWSPEISARVPSHVFPRGWVNTKKHPYAWQPSIAYNAPLGLYMMTTWGMGTAPDGFWFGKPSYLGFWIASEPWGPWLQIYEETQWLPGGDPSALAFQPQIAPKWIAADGKSFWLVWSDFQQRDEPTWKRYIDDHAKERRRNQIGHDALVRAAVMQRKHMPFYAFNVQRVDFIFS